MGKVKVDKTYTRTKTYESPKTVDGKLSYSLYDKDGNKVGNTLVDPGTDMSNAQSKYFTKGENGQLNMSDHPSTSVTMNPETGKITVAAPSMALKNETFKKSLSDTMKNLSAAYKSNPDYKFSITDEEGNTKEKSIDDVINELNAPSTNEDGSYNQNSLQYMATAAIGMEKVKEAHKKNVELDDNDVIRMDTVAVGPDVKDNTLQLISNLPEAAWLRNVETYDKDTGFAQYGDIMENAYNKEKTSSEDMIRLWAALENYFAKGDYSDKEEYIRNVATARFLDATQPNMAWIRDVTENVNGFFNSIGGYATELGTAGWAAVEEIGSAILGIPDDYYDYYGTDYGDLYIARGGNQFATDMPLEKVDAKIGRVKFDENGVPSYVEEKIEGSYENPRTTGQMLRAIFKENQAVIRKDMEYLHASQAGWDSVGYALTNLAALISAGNVLSDMFVVGTGALIDKAAIVAGRTAATVNDLTNTAKSLYATGTALKFGSTAAEAAQIISGMKTIYDISAATGKSATFLNFIGQAVRSAKATEFIIGVVGESVAEAVVGDNNRLIEVLDNKEIDADTKNYLVETYIWNAVGWGVGLGVGKILMNGGETTRGRAISANLSKRLFKIQNSVGEAFDQTMLTIRRVKGDNLAEKIKTLYEEGGRYSKKQANALAASAALREMRRAIAESDSIQILGKGTDEIEESLKDIELKIAELKNAEVALTSMQRQGVDIVQGWLKDDGKGLKEVTENFYSKASEVAKLERNAGDLFKPTRGAVSDMTNGKTLRLFSQTTTNYIKASEKIDFINAYINKYEHSGAVTQDILAKIRAYREELPELRGMVREFVQNASPELRLAANNFIDADRKWWAKYEDLRARLGLTDADELKWFRASKLWGTNGELYARTTRKADLSEYVVKHRDGSSNVKTFDVYERYMAGATGDFADPMGEMQIALYDAGNKQAYRSFAKSYNKLTGTAMVKVSGEETALYQKMEKGLKSTYFKKSESLLKGFSDDVQNGVIENVIKNLQAKNTQYGDIQKTKGAMKTAVKRMQEKLTEVTSANANKYIVRLGAEDTNALWDDFYNVSVRELIEGAPESLPTIKDTRPVRNTVQLKSELVGKDYAPTDDIKDIVFDANKKRAKEIYRSRTNRDFKKYPNTKKGLEAWYKDNPVASDYSKAVRGQKGEIYEKFVQKYSQELLPGADEYVNKDVWDIVDIKTQNTAKSKDIIPMQVRRFIYGQARELGIDIDKAVELQGKLKTQPTTKITAAVTNDDYPGWNITEHPVWALDESSNKFDGMTRRDYYRKAQGKEFRVLEIPTNEYNQIMVKDDVGRMLSKSQMEVANSYVEKFKNGERADIPYIEYDKSGKIIGQEGRHRTIAAYKAGIEKAPVVIEYPVNAELPENLRGYRDVTENFVLRKQGYDATEGGIMGASEVSNIDNTIELSGKLRTPDDIRVADQFYQNSRSIDEILDKRFLKEAGIADKEDFKQYLKTQLDEINAKKPSWRTDDPENFMRGQDFWDTVYQYRADKMAETFNLDENKDFLKKIGWDRGYVPVSNVNFNAAYVYDKPEKVFYDLAEKYGGPVHLQEQLMINLDRVLSLPELQSIELHELSHAVWARASIETRQKIGQDLISRLGLDISVDEAMACSRDMDELIAYATETRFDIGRGFAESLGENKIAQKHLNNLAKHAGVKNDKTFRERVLGVVESFVTFVKTKLLGINSAKTFDDFYEGLISGDFSKDLRRELGEFPFDSVSKNSNKLEGVLVREGGGEANRTKSRLLSAYDNVNKALAGTADTPDVTFEQQVKRLIMSHNEDILNDTRVQKALTDKERYDYLARNEAFYREKADELKFLEEQYGITKEELSVAGGTTIRGYIESMTQEGTGQRNAIDELCKYYGLEGDENAIEYFALSAYMDSRSKYKHEIATQIRKAIEQDHPEFTTAQNKKVAGIITNGIDSSLENEFNDAYLVVKEINPNAVRNSDERVMAEVDRIAKEIENAESNRYAGEKNIIAMRNMEGKVEYYQTDPLLARLVNFQYLPEKMNGFTQAIYNTNYLWAKLFRLGTTAINVKSMISQSFRDPINMFIGGGAYRTTQRCMDDIVDVAGDDIVAWIKTYEPEALGRLEKEAAETGEDLKKLAVEREFAIGKGLSPTTTETWMYRSLNTAKRARLNGVLDVYDDTVGDKTVRAIDKVGETLGKPNEWRETTLRNLSYQNGLSTALKRGYSLDQARTFATFVMNESTTNFTRMTNHLVSLKDTVPYFGSAVNGAKSFYKLLSMDPVGVVGRLIGGLIIPSMALTAYSLMDEENKKVYKNIPEYQKEDAIVFMVDGQIVSIPIPQELGSFIAPFRQTVEGMNDVSTNTFAQLAWHDILGFSPVDLTGFANLDFAKLETSSPGFLERIGDGIARMWSQLAPPALKSGLEVVTGVDPYTGKAIDKSYLDYDEDGNPIIKDYQSGELAKLLNKMFRSWGLTSSAPVVQNILSNIIGQGSVDIADFLVSLGTQVPNGGWAFSATEEQLAMGEVYNPLYVMGERLTDPVAMDAYNEAQSAWKTEVTKLYARKEEILNSKEWQEYIEAKKSTTDPEKLKNINASGKDIVRPYYETVKNVVNNLQANYGEEFTAAKFATVLSLMTMDKQTLDLGAYGNYLEKEAYKTARSQAIQTMINMGFPSVASKDVLGKFVTSKDGDIFVRTYHPLAILQLDDVSGSSIYSQSNRQHHAVIRNLLSDGNAYDIREDYYNNVDKAYDAKDYNKVEELMNEYNEKIIRLIYPYIKQYTPESVLQGDVMDYLEDYIMVPSSFMGKGKYYSSKTGLNKQQGYAKNYIKAIFHYGENKLNGNR